MTTRKVPRRVSRSTNDLARELLFTETNAEGARKKLLELGYRNPSAILKSLMHQREIERQITVVLDYLSIVDQWKTLRSALRGAYRLTGYQKKQPVRVDGIDVSEAILVVEKFLAMHPAIGDHWAKETAAQDTRSWQLWRGRISGDREIAGMRSFLDRTSSKNKKIVRDRLIKLGLSPAIASFYMGESSAAARMRAQRDRKRKA